MQPMPRWGWPPQTKYSKILFLEILASVVFVQTVTILSAITWSYFQGVAKLAIGSYL